MTQDLNFGLLSIDWEARKLVAEIRSVHGSEFQCAQLFCLSHLKQPPCLCRFNFSFDELTPASYMSAIHCCFHDV